MPQTDLPGTLHWAATTTPALTQRCVICQRFLTHSVRRRRLMRMFARILRIHARGQKDTRANLEELNILRRCRGNQIEITDRAHVQQCFKKYRNYQLNQKTANFCSIYCLIH